MAVQGEAIADSILKKCVNGQAVYPVKAQERRYTA